MSLGVLIAAASLVVVAGLHSYFGERMLLVPLFESPNFPEPPGGGRLAKKTLRFAWHLTTLAWLTIAYLLARGDCAPETAAVLLASSALLTHAATGGRHGAWALFALGAVAATSAAVDRTSLAQPAAAVGAALLAAVGGMHVAWAFGLRWGLRAAVPERAGAPVFEPGRAVTLAVALASFLAAWLLLALAGLATLPLPAGWQWAGGLVAALVFAARTVGDGRFVGLSKRVVGTRFARFDDALFTPLCFVFCAAMALQLG